MSRTRIAVLGIGLVGRVIVDDLLADPNLQVIAVDARRTGLDQLGSHPRLEVRQADLSRPASVAETALAARADLVVGAVPGALGSALLEGVLTAGLSLVDISFSPDDPTRWDGMARQRGLTVVVDCGLAPGLSNLLAGHETARLETVHRIEILVGGLPIRRVLPYEYRFVFSPGDVIEEYTRPCHFREDGVERVRPALSDVERVEFPEVGTLEAFNTDGLRTLLTSLPAPTLKEKTLRYPGHARKMRLLRETGFFSLEPVQAGGVRVAPRAVTEELLRQRLALQDGEEEITLLRVTVEGEANHQQCCSTWNVVDRTDLAKGQSSMARTTAFPCAQVARLVASGRWRSPGIHPPEVLGRDDGIAQLILDGLRERGIHLRRTSVSTKLPLAPAQPFRSDARSSRKAPSPDKEVDP
ncbi:MAG: saccharopine dehydrogenase family protein [Acidobacteriota bacterium]